LIAAVIVGIMQRKPGGMEGLLARSLGKEGPAVRGCGDDGKGTRGRFAGGAEKYWCIGRTEKSVL